MKILFELMSALATPVAMITILTVSLNISSKLDKIIKKLGK
jgi:hypothetical protein